MAFEVGKLETCGIREMLVNRENLPFLYNFISALNQSQIGATIQVNVQKLSGKQGET